MLKVVSSYDDLLKVFMVRGIVFIEEQQVLYAEEIDEFEHSSIHILGEIDGEPVAAGRIRFVGEYAKLERIAIRRAYRRYGYGHKLVDYMLFIARSHGFSRFFLNAQAHLVDFYGQHGFSAVGELFVEANIDHFKMVRHDREQEVPTDLI